MRFKILVADDDESVGRSIGVWLNAEGYAVLHAYSAPEALTKAVSSRPDAVLLDVMFGGADGRSVCRRLREDPATTHIPVILMSGAKMSEEDIVSGLHGGADDYLLKPLKRKLLAAKLEAILRRSRAPEELARTLKAYGVELRPARRQVKVGTKAVELTAKEFDLLTVLLRKRGKVLSPGYLLETVWGYELENYNDPHTVHVHVSRLKKKLGRSFGGKIRSVVGSGYVVD